MPEITIVERADLTGQDFEHLFDPQDSGDETKRRRLTIARALEVTLPGHDISFFMWFGGIQDGPFVVVGDPSSKRLFIDEDRALVPRMRVKNQAEAMGISPKDLQEIASAYCPWQDRKAVSHGRPTERRKARS